MEEGYELDLTYITERIIAVSFPRGCSEEIYSHNLKDVTRMLKSKHADNYLIINLSERRHDLSRMNPKTLDTGWPDLHAPPLDKICTICKAMESWLNADPLHVVVIHCRGGKGRIGVVISSFVHFTDVSASADQALDRFAMRKYYDDKVSALMTPSQKRYVWILNSLLSGSMKINASPLFLHCVILHGIPNFDATRVCRPYIKVYQGMQAVYSSGVYHIGPGHRDRVCISLEPAQLLKGDIMIKCYHKSDVIAEREVIFRLQFHTGAVQGYNLMFEKEDMETANKDSRFPDYGKVELVFSEGPEKIPGADRWQNGADVIVDYNTADPLTRWDSYQNICDGEAPRSQGLSQDKAANKRSPNGGEATLGRGARTTSATSSPDHSDHALSVSSDSGLSSTSLWADRPTPVTTTTTTTANTAATAVKANQGPSQKEKVQLKRLLSGFGLEDPSPEEMDDQGPRVGIQQTVPAQVHINGDPQPRERETDILDDEVITGHDLHSVDSLGTLSSSCHKSSQNSLLSDGFGSPAGEEQQSQSQHHLHHAAPPPMEEYERSYAEARRGCLSSRSNSVASSNPSSAPVPKQHVYRQGSYSTQSWVRQQQMVAAQQFVYMPEDGNDTERYPGSKQGSSLPKAGLPMEPQGPSRDTTAPHKEQATINNNNNNKRDEEFKSLTMDIDNSIDQLNQLIMDLDPTFVPVSSHSGSIKRNGSAHVNGSAGKCSNGIDLRFNNNNAATLKNTQQTAVQSGEVRAGVTRNLSCQRRDVTDHPGFCNSGWGETEEYRGQGTYSPCVPQSQLQHSMLYRSDSADFRAQGPDVDSGVEAGSDMTPPTPAFPISPPTPYVKNMSEFTHLRQTSPPSAQSFGGYRTDHEPRGYPEISHVGVESLPDSSINCHRTLSSSHSASIVGTIQQTDSSSVSQSWPEHPALTRHSSLSSYPSARPPAHHAMSLDYGHHSPPLHHPHIHPAPNAHSSPRSSQRSRMACYARNRSPAQSFDEQDDSGLGYGTDCPSMGIDRDLLSSMDGQNQLQTPQIQPPLLPEKKRASDGDHSLGTASPALSGFSSPHSGSSLSIPFPNVLPDLSAQTPGTASPLPDVLASKQVTVKFVQDTSKFWYKPDISRDQAISVLKDKEPGCFIVRDSHSFRGAYGLAMKVATPPPSVLQQSKKGGDLSNELVRHFLIECTQKGVRLKGCPNEPYFGSLTALVCQHSITPLALPCKLIIPDRDPLEDVVENTSQSVTNSAAELLKQGAACNVWYLGSVEMESLTGVQAVQKATGMTLNANPPPTSTVVHFKVSSQGITLTDNQRKLFFRRHYNVNTVIFCALDPQDRKWKKDGCPPAKIFGFVARKTGTSMDNICHLFAEHDPEQPASAIVNFVSKVMIGSHKSK
ncbi:tensin-3 isoform X1 [Stegastes partitus]|uniref:Tensin 3 n=1 Tax=Stegastes partitus TaxID=144197 RepID=A0A3B4ZQZ5_9TELE|nr:PREDICTED: tensin-3 isoform X1 [Stegastes partitus]XP_008298605.1 PREDICTED: tensin-3 isoform X1 [Stegastes partitus]